MGNRAIRWSVGLILVLAATGSLAQSPDVEVSALNTAADLDLSGEIVYAINFGNNGNPRLGGVVFSQDQDYPNLSRDISAEGVISTWGGIYPNTGDANLDMLLDGIIWKNSTRTGRTTSVTITGGLTVGLSYQLQLIFYTDHSRPMDIIVEGDTIIERYEPYTIQGSVTGKGGSVVRYVFTAVDTTLNVAAKSNPDVDASLLCSLILAKHWPPSPDFNGDWKIDIEDLVMLIEHWGKNEPSLDLAPPPAGDGIVDGKDLEVFMSHWGQELDDPSLLAHWKLDETEGSVAADSAGAYAGTLFGAPLWQPSGGKLGGALQFDGSPRFVTTKFVCDLGAGPFSVLCWVKDGAPGQVILSQEDDAKGNAGESWLCCDPVTGHLVTTLSPKPGGRLAHV